MLSTPRFAFVVVVCLGSGCSKPPAVPDPSDDGPVETREAETVVPPDAWTTPIDASTTPIATGWRKLAPKGEGFSVDVSGEPERELKPVQGPQGHTSNLIQYTVASDEMVLIVSASPTVAQLVEHGNKELALDRTLATQTDVPGRTVRYKKKITLGEAVGREAEVDLTLEGQAARLHMQLYMHGARMFTVLAIWPQPDSASAAPAGVERFFTSFALTGDESAVGAPIDLWQAVPVPELGLTVELPKKPTVTTTPDSDTFMGNATVVSIEAETSFPVSGYTIEVAIVPAAHASKSDDALLALWKEARLAPGPTGDKPTFVRDGASELLGDKGRVLIVRATNASAQTLEGELRAIVERKDGKASRVIVASLWVLDPKEVPTLSKRFFDKIRRAPDGPR